LGLPISAVLCDLDGVLRIWTAQLERDAEAAGGLPEGAIREAAFSRELLVPAITGQLRDEDWRRKVAERLGTRFPQDAAARAVEAWSSSAGIVNREVLDLLRQCRAQVPVALITNATSRLPRDLERLDLTREVDHVVNSSDVGAAKPDAAIFHAALQIVRVPAARALFIDDSAAHVEQARVLGLAAHHYRGVDGLRAELSRHSLL
jgi:putative hydrolase of the HAD superfamily